MYPSGLNLSNINPFHSALIFIIFQLILCVSSHVRTYICTYAFIFNTVISYLRIFMPSMFYFSWNQSFVCTFDEVLR